MSPANNRSTYLPYAPGNPPVLDNTRELGRATWDELIRVAQSLIDLDRPVCLALKSSDTLTATASGQTYSRLFDSTQDVIEYEQPGGTMNNTTGIYTIPQEGVYQVYCRMNVPAFPSPQTKSYIGYIRFTLTKAAGGSSTVILESSGLDDTILTVQGQGLFPLHRGDTLYFDGAITRAAGGGSVVVTDTLQIIRVSGLI